MKDEFEKLGIIFTDTDSAFKRISRTLQGIFFKTCSTNRQQISCSQFSRLVWRYIHLCTKGVKVDVPLQTYFRINAENTGQFERTLIIVDEGASIHYVEGCTAPTYSSNSLHAAIVEIFTRKRCVLPLHNDPKLV